MAASKLIQSFLFLQFSKQDNSFNVNLAIFLSQLRSYSEREGVPIDRNTVDMLSEAVYTIDRIVSNTNPKPPTENDSVDFIFNLETESYKIRPYIVCRLCSVSKSLKSSPLAVQKSGFFSSFHSNCKNGQELILASKADFEAHVQKDVHQRVVQNEKEMAALTKLFPTNAATTQNDMEKAVVRFINFFRSSTRISNQMVFFFFLTESNENEIAGKHG